MEYPVHDWLSHIGVNQQHALGGLGESKRRISGGSGLAIAGIWTGDCKNLLFGGRKRKHDVSSYGLIAFHGAERDPLVSYQPSLHLRIGLFGFFLLFLF